MIVAVLFDGVFVCRCHVRFLQQRSIFYFVSDSVLVSDSVDDNTFCPNLVSKSYSFTDCVRLGLAFCIGIVLYCDFRSDGEVFVFDTVSIVMLKAI